MRCSAVLLAGGKSTRMGRDKALIEIDGEPLWRRQLEILRQLSPEQLMISGPARDGCETIADEFEDAGPLAGVAAALRKCSAPLLVVLAIDLPKMTTEFFRSLLALCCNGKGVVPRGPKFFEPLAAVYPAASAELADGALQSGEYAMQDFVRVALNRRLLIAHEISPAEMPLFANANRPDDL
jgi:molybdopterin-guanine dinucleotide biosynthesis protein A